MRVVEDQIYSDVEKLYDGIERIIDTNTNTNCHPLINQIRDHQFDIPYDQIIEELKRLLFIIREILLESFVISSDVRKLIGQMYDMVWEVMKSNGTDELQVFTTNYDTVIEEYCNETNRGLVNGFNTYHHLNKHWNDEWTAGAANSVYLTKLHGSINWHKDADGEIVETGGIEQRDVSNDIMIIPTEGTKRYDNEPFSALMKRFEAEIKKVDVLLVIGFSYRDEEIARIIRDRVRDGMALISVSPNAVKDIRLVSDSDVKTKEISGQQIKFIDTQIILCDQAFGLDTIDDIRAALDTYYRFIRRHIRRARRKGENATLTAVPQVV